MSQLVRMLLLLTLPVAVLWTSPLYAAEPAATQIVVGEMCGGCAKKITARLKKMPGVGKIVCDIPTKTVKITPAANTTLSPKALWEAMDEIGKKPVKMTGPKGTFTAAPTS